ncbi:DUF1460 domain-containing protein [Ideonella sp. 4Y16]|uniref:DUF1460 domain-containing protein n=1 Tax=Ideonella alba TaxID=2824118 RepID=A0A941BJ88_9BURK|nr:N-acetylmuramoyl-L-alanine amidase-like domain-containing protein [Ideonella alba]MBQ0933558.1 DUF1460 domain-containing protein [Ideonella alba]MBQ0946553.1 DUF1460 domain-containing protein [Ideonella alba]
MMLNNPAHLGHDELAAASYRPTLVLELGERWSRERLEALLATLARERDVGKRMELACRELVGTPFLAESKLPLLPDGCLRFRLETMDCCTAIYNLIALVHSRDINVLGQSLASIRYADGALKNHPATGTFLGFASEVLFGRAVAKGFVSNVTAEVACGVELQSVRLNLQPHRRPHFLDANETIVLPRYASGSQEFLYISVESFSGIDWSRLRTGDIVLFTRGARLKDGSPNFDFVNHLGIASCEPDKIALLHSTRHFTVAPSRPGTGVFYDDACRREQIGFGYAGLFLGEEHAIDIDGDRIYGYDSSRKRSLVDYAQSNFAGIAVLRCGLPAACP